MDDSYKINYDMSKPIETIFDFHNAQIIRVNTENSTLFLAEGKIFDEEVLKRVDNKGRCRIIYIVDKMPPLSAVLSFISRPFPTVDWGIYAVIAPNDENIIKKFAPIISYGLNLTFLKGKFTLRIFENHHRNDLTEVIKWMDSNMNKETSGVSGAYLDEETNVHV